VASPHFFSWIKLPTSETLLVAARNPQFYREKITSVEGDDKLW
jgi:hypothetical protein